MRWILGLLGALVGSVVGDEEGLACGAVLGLLIGWVIERERLRSKLMAQAKPAIPGQGMADAYVPAQTTPSSDVRLVELTRRVETLERQVAALRTGVVETAPVMVADDRGYPVEATAVPTQASDNVRWREYYEQQEKAEAVPVAPVEVPVVTPVAPPASPGAPPVAPLEPWLEAVRSFFFGGNTVVRVGILVLTIGVGLLVKYAADANYFPLELRLAFAASIALALVVVGFAQRHKRPSFATALQGGGVAALYLVTFFSFYAYQLLPASLTLALLIAIAAFSSVLAVVQNAQQLAVFGAIGGFLSPVLASTGGGSHVALFSYYALLNVALCGMAVFRSWRILNWTGFLFTFGIASAWGALQYKPENMLSASLFLLLFFLLYVVNGTLFALRQPAERRGTIDTTLTFGTPLATLALAGGLFVEQPLFLALACVVIASVYLGFARALVVARDESLLALSRAYIAVGIGVATLAVPFALDDALGTALAWSAEASGLVWVGVRQQRLRTRVAGYLLFAGSLFALLVRQDDASSLGRTVFCALIALALSFAAMVIEHQRERVHTAERYVGHGLFVLALLVWTSASEALISFAPLELRASMWLIAIAITTVMLELVGTYARFSSARTASTFAFPLLLLGSLDLLSVPASPLDNLGWLGFPLAIAAAYFALHRNESRLQEQPVRADVLHASAAYFVAVLVFAQLRYLTRDQLALGDGWSDGVALAAPLLVVGVALAQKPAWPLAQHARGYLAWAAWPLVLLLSLASLFVHAESEGSVAPLPYLPLLNPLDLAQALLIALTLLVARTAVVRSAQTRRIAIWSCALSGFVALNATVARTVHHWLGVPFVAYEVPSDPVVQASFSILWTTLALIAMLIAHRRATREVWVAGAALLAAVVVKLFFVDLSSLGGVAKIVTFLAVGLLLLLIGYFAPVPPTRRAVASQDPRPEEGV